MPFFIHFGRREVLRFPYEVFRYQCRACKKVFSSSYFELSYWDKKNDLYEEIFELSRRGMPARGVADFLKINEATVRRKKVKLIRQALLRMAKDNNNLKIKEPIAFDGIENFSFSQFDPNNINHAVGKESYFVYDFNFAPLNRKGCMSPLQRKKLKKLDEKFGRYPKDAIFSSSKRIFERLLSKTSGNLILHSDNHYAYHRALREIKGNNRIAHFVTPSKVARNYRNRLFPINHLDMLTRHELSSFKRETIAFSKHSIAMIENFILYVTYKNYMRPIFTKKHKIDHKAHLESPAQRLGLTHKVFKFRDFFKTRISRWHVKLNEDWDLYYQRLDPASRRPIQPYARI